MASTLSTKTACVIAVAALAALGLAGCGSGEATGRRSEAHASLVKEPSSLAEIRTMSSAIVEGVAGKPVDGVVESGPAEGVAMTRTPFTVTKAVWGDMPQGMITVSRVAIVELEDAPLVEGQHYLLYLVPAGVGSRAGDYAVTMGAGYVLSGDSYTYNGKPPRYLPSSIPASTVAQLATS